MERIRSAFRENVQQGIVGVFLVGFLLGTLVGWLLQPESNANETVEDGGSGKQEETVPAGQRSQGVEAQGAEENETAALRVLGARISVEDQPAGNVVVVKSFQLPPEGGWLVVHEIGPDMTLRNALGAHRYDSSVTSGVVELLRPTQPGNQYAVVLYRDNGDRQFSLQEDHPFLDAQTNAPILDLFTAQPPRE